MYLYLLRLYIIYIFTWQQTEINMCWKLINIERFLILGRTGFHRVNRQHKQSFFQKNFSSNRLLFSEKKRKNYLKMKCFGRVTRLPFGDGLLVFIDRSSSKITFIYFFTEAFTHGVWLYWLFRFFKNQIKKKHSDPWTQKCCGCFLLLFL